MKPKVYIANLTQVNEANFDRDACKKKLVDDGKCVAQLQNYNILWACESLELPDGWFRDPIARSEALLGLGIGLEVYDAGGAIETQGDALRIIAEETGLLDELIEERIKKYGK